MRPLPNVIQLTHSFDSVASTAFSLEDLKVSERIFRFPTASGWLLPETTLRFFTCTGKSRSSLVDFSSFQRHHYRSFDDTFLHPCNLHAVAILRMGLGAMTPPKFCLAPQFFS